MNCTDGNCVVLYSNIFDSGIGYISHTEIPIAHEQLTKPLQRVVHRLPPVSFVVDTGLKLIIHIDRAIMYIPKDVPHGDRRTLLARQMKDKIGFVPQNDYLLPNLTGKLHTTCVYQDSLFILQFGKL